MMVSYYLRYYLCIPCPALCRGGMVHLTSSHGVCPVERHAITSLFCAYQTASGAYSLLAAANNASDMPSLGRNVSWLRATVPITQHSWLAMGSASAVCPDHALSRSRAHMTVKAQGKLQLCCISKQIQSWLILLRLVHVCRDCSVLQPSALHYKVGFA